MTSETDGGAYEEFMKCSICLETLNNDRMLPCSHMFCLECLGKYTAFKREIQCPECRASHQVPAGGVKNFPRNVKLNQFLEQLCPDCSKNPRTEICAHCEKTICSTCKVAHMAAMKDDITSAIRKLENLGALEAKYSSEAKKDKKVLKDKEKLIERELTKSADCIVKFVRDREKKLKNEVKDRFQNDTKTIDSKLKTRLDKITKLRQMAKKFDVKKLSDDSLAKLKQQWGEIEKSKDTTAEDDTLPVTTSLSATNLKHSIDTSKIQAEIKMHWMLNSGDDGDRVSVDTMSISSVPSSPKQVEDDSFVRPSNMFGKLGEGLGHLDSPFAIAISPATKDIIVSDTKNNRLHIFDASGRAIKTYGRLGQNKGQFEHPIGLAVTPTGEIFVADTANHRVEQLTSKGDVVGSFGKEGSHVTEFCQPWGIVIDSSGNLFISDCENKRVQVMTQGGRYIRTVGKDFLTNPTGIAVSRAGELYVADCDNHRIQVFSIAGRHMRTIGHEGSGAGQLSYPDGLVLDNDGNIVVVEWGNHRVQVFNKEGKSIRMFGRHGSAPGEFDQPRGVAVTDDGRILVCDCGNSRIQMFC